MDVVTTGGTRHDTKDGQFIQNWQTPKRPGACYRVTMNHAGRLEHLGALQVEVVEAIG